MKGLDEHFLMVVFTEFMFLLQMFNLNRETVKESYETILS